MRVNFQDPALLIPVGVILIGLVLLIWALGKLFKKSPAAEDTLPEAYPTLPDDNELFNAPFPQSPLPPVENRAATSPATPGTNREMASRLDNMTQKLSDMQSVLQRQATTAPPGAPLTPETIDKLLKIIGNVTQQVDILQKNLAVSATPGVPAGQTVTPQPEHVRGPAATVIPTAVPAVGGRSIGVTGGALSSFARQAPPDPKAAAAPGTPPATPGPTPMNPPSGK